MSRRSLSQLSPQALLARLRELIARERHLTVEILEVLIEADWRRLWAEAGYPSMYHWCMGEFGFSEDQAAKRICAARQARKHPEILAMVADGRLHLSGLLVLAPKLREAPERAGELLAASARRSRRAIEALLAERFPQADAPTQVIPIGASPGPDSPAPGRVAGAQLLARQRPDFELPAPGRANQTGPGAAMAADAAGSLPAPGRVEETGNGSEAPDPPEPVPAPGRVEASYSRVTPTAPQRYAVQFTMDEAMHADLIRAQELLGHQDPDDDRVRAVFRRALRDLVQSLEKRKLAATDKPRAQRAGGRKTRAQVKREVRERDQDQCAWITEDGRRCGERKHLQFDHIRPAGRGGGWTTENIRLLCPAHNRLAAEQVYGEGFMHQTVERHREARERARRPHATAVPAGTDAAAPAPPDPTEPASSRRYGVISRVPVAPALPDPLSCAPAQAARTAPPCP